LLPLLLLPLLLLLLLMLMLLLPLLLLLLLQSTYLVTPSSLSARTWTPAPRPAPWIHSVQACVSSGAAWLVRLDTPHSTAPCRPTLEHVVRHSYEGKLVQ
jgi:hypothetical protein